jgi:hypothetical protein
MGGQSPAKLLRSVIRMTKFLERKLKTSRSKPVLTSIVLPGVDISPVLPTLSIMHVESTTVLSQTQPLPSTVSDRPHNDASSQNLDASHAKLNQEIAATSPEINDTLTRSKFFEIMNKFQEDLLKPL